MIQAKYTCGTCGMEITEGELRIVQGLEIHKGKSKTIKEEKVFMVVDEKKLWHECADGYVVPLQSIVEKYVPVQEKNSK